MKNNPKYSVVVPVYNTVNSLVELTKRINVVFQHEVKESFEIIFVDDASPNPETWQTLLDLKSKNENSKIIQLSRNFGQHAATLCGLREARGEFVITLDDDLQHNPEDIPELIKYRDNDMVIGVFKVKSHNFFRKFVSGIKGWFDCIIIGIPKNVRLTSFRVLNRVVVDGMLLIETPYPFIPALMFNISKAVKNVDVMHGKRLEGKSGYNFFRLIKLFSRLIISNSSLLLRMVAFGGMFLAILSFTAGSYFLVRKLFFNIGVKGWTSLIVSIFFLGGITLFSVGTIGEYLLRIIQTTEKKPTYFIRKKIE